MNTPLPTSICTAILRFFKRRPPPAGRDVNSQHINAIGPVIVNQTINNHHIPPERYPPMLIVGTAKADQFLYEQKRARDAAIIAAQLDQPSPRTSDESEADYLRRLNATLPSDH
jgi:hypothetical protein